MTDEAQPLGGLDDMTREELLALLRERTEEGIRISFTGKDVARSLARKVQPRTSRRLAKYSCGPEDEQARNLVIEGENLQAMVTMYRDRGQVDLIVTDPPYNTGRDFRYNDRWDEDPNDPGIGELVTEEDGARHTKWMRFMFRHPLRPTATVLVSIGSAAPAASVLGARMSCRSEVSAAPSEGERDGSLR